jgi:hypothetical protein
MQAVVPSMVPKIKKNSNRVVSLFVYLLMSHKKKLPHERIFHFLSHGERKKTNTQNTVHLSELPLVPGLNAIYSKLSNGKKRR